MSGWIVLGAITLWYLHRERGKVTQGIAPSPCAQAALDPTRWRHDGSQPVSYKDGNAAPFPDYTAQDLLGLSAFNTAIGPNDSQ